MTSGVTMNCNGDDKTMIYLDNAASTVPSEAVINKINEVVQAYGNPSSLHNIGMQARNYIIEARHIISEKMNCKENELYFTSGATMSNNVFIQGFLRKYPNGRLIISAIEHNDIIMLADYLDSIHGKGWVHRIRVTKHGQIDFVKLNTSLIKLTKKKVPVLCCVQWANGECGTIQDMECISKLIHQYPNTYLYTDATQYVPYFKVDLDKYQIDGLGMSGQKINCIKGTGLLYIRNGVDISPIIFGEQGLIGGTENVVGIAALGVAFNELKYDNRELYEKRDYILKELSKCGMIIGSFKNRLPNNVCVYFDKYDGDYFVVMLNELGICASSGSACSSGNGEPSHVILAMGYSPKVANSCIRFTLSKDNTEKELHEVCEIVNEILNY